MNTTPAAIDSPAEHRGSVFSYHVIFTLAVLGGVLGVLMMIPLRRALIVNEHKNLPYPEGTACAQVLIAGERAARWPPLRTGAGLRRRYACSVLKVISGALRAT